MTLSASRTGHPPIEDVGGATSTSAGAPPITQITFLTCRAQYPGGPNRCVSVSSLSARPSPVNRRVGIHDFTFEACSSFTRVTACKIARPPKGGLYPEASTRSVTRPSRSVATMLTDNYIGGSSFHWRSAPLGRTVNSRGRPNRSPADRRHHRRALDRDGPIPFDITRSSATKARLARLGRPSWTGPESLHP